MLSNHATISQKIDAITKIPESHRYEVCPAPKSVKIELTARCDLKCFFCATSKGLRKKGDMDFDFLQHILLEMKEEGVKEIGMFYLGESLLYPRLAEAIRFAKHTCGFDYVFLTTNGRLLTKNKARDIISAGLDSLKFSFNSFCSEQYKNTTGVDAFDTVVANIHGAKEVRDEVLRETGHKCGLYASSIRYDEEQYELMDKTVDVIKRSLDEHYWLPLYNQAGYTTGVRGTKPTAGNRGRIGALRDSLPCWALFTEGHIAWTGMLTGCCFSHEEAWDFGDLNHMGFMEAWNSEAAQKLRRANLAKDVTGTACEKCIACS
jgi:MoaA/NifB/PqqE/SkfB family radical SAM enzyme